MGWGTPGPGRGVTEGISSKLQGIYHTANLNYPNLRSGNIRTVAPDALILTRQYRSPKMQTPQRMFRDCFVNNLEVLQETPKKHRKWQEVSLDNHGNWEWYELAAAAPVPAEGPPGLNRKTKR